ncbi:MAG: hypothetical protein ACKD6N_07870 [Candidatus Bathyarchaeota archaeon]
MSEKKVVGRNVAITLAIACIVLAAGLVGAIAYYTSVTESLKSAQLHEVNFNWEWHEPWMGKYYVRVTGVVFNSGEYTAKNTRIDIWLYDSNKALIKSYTINLGEIPGKSYRSFSVEVEYGKIHCAQYEYKIGYD